MEKAINALPDAVQELLGETSFLVFAAVVGLVLALGSCRIFAKAGYHGALGLLILVPGVNVAMFLWLAFARWPVRTELRALRRVQHAARRVDQGHLRRAA